MINFLVLKSIFKDLIAYFLYCLQISVIEMILNKQNVMTLPRTNETIMKHTFHSIKFGGKYNITVATDVENAISTPPFIYIAPPIKSPHQLTVLQDNREYFIYWQEPDLPESISKDSNWHYEILVTEGSTTINESTAKIVWAKQPPYIYKDAKSGTIYTFAVRLVTDEGYQSSLSAAWSTRFSGKYFFISHEDRNKLICLNNAFSFFV